MQTAPHDEKARIAAEVAARYGVQVQPDAVQFVPRGVSGYPGYVYQGNSLVPAVKEAHGHAYKRAINASWKEAARKRRVTKAREMENRAPAAPPPHTPEGEAHRIARIKAKAKARADEIRARVEGGATIEDIARLLGASIKGAQSYCWRYGIKPVANSKVAAEAKRRAQVLAFCEGGNRTVAEVAALMGNSPSAAHKYLNRHGIAYRHVMPTKATKPARDAQKATRKVGAEFRRAEQAAAVALRREKVRAMFLAGKNGQQIADALGVTRGPVWKDIKAMGLRREDYYAAGAFRREEAA